MTRTTDYDADRLDISINAIRVRSLKIETRLMNAMRMATRQRQNIVTSVVNADTLAT